MSSTAAPSPGAGAGPYGRGAIRFHWVMFVLVVVVGTLGLLHDSWPHQTQAFWINIHALVGLLLWSVLIARFCWRLRHPPPPLPPDVGELSRRLSGPVHLLLYAIFHPTEDVHGYLAYALFALGGAHALTALWHHFVRHDGILRRMWR